jgi:hypothetical protein
MSAQVQTQIKIWWRSLESCPGSQYIKCTNKCDTTTHGGNLTALVLLQAYCGLLELDSCCKHTGHRRHAVHDNGLGLFAAVPDHVECYLDMVLGLLQQYWTMVMQRPACFQQESCSNSLQVNH